MLPPTPSPGGESVLAVPRINRANRALVGRHAAVGPGSRRWEMARCLGHNDEHLDTLEGRVRICDLLSREQAGRAEDSGLG
ncbi:MAG TPA: hypothetical protein VGS80_01875, partial [Ktedonobacterales bacterium]|nr:hypothetical protein [Ktedonobacterales bacterium]